MKKNTPRLIVHGGAWNIPEAYWQNHLDGVHHAIEITFPELQKGMTAMDAVEMAVRSLEEDPTFDAGKGAFLNEIGEVELDAIIMDGRNLDFGAVGAIQNILHPVSVARQVLEKTDHCFLVGNGALEFAKKMDFKELPPESLLTERELEFFHEIKNNPNYKTRLPFEFQPRDTVGAVALDQYGNIAAATSTGGTARKLKGRVGDAPIAGAGAYADNELGGASATGWGESIMKVLLSKKVCDLQEEKDAMTAAKIAIEYLHNKVNGLGGIISIDKNGNYGFHNNTPKMAKAYAEENGNIISMIH